MTISEQFSRTVTRIAQSKPSAAAERSCVNLVTDSVGVALAGKDQAGIRETRDLLHRYCTNPQGATVLFEDDRLTPWEAAYLNSAMIHALDFDDGHPEANTHFMSSVVPSALAATALHRCDGERFLRAVILGVEAGSRLARWYLTRATNRMWLTSTIIGGFGAVTAAGEIVGLSTEERVEAFGIYFALASGTRQALVEHTLTKRFQPANAARAAVWSVLSARAGIDAAHQIVEGEGGLLALYGVSDDASGTEPFLDREVSEWEIVNEHIKRYPTCGAHHPAMYAASELSRELPDRIGELKSIDVYIGRDAEQLVGGRFYLGSQPQTDAQFSAAYGVAYCLIHGDFDLEAIRPETVTAAHRVHGLASRVRFLKEWEGAAGSPPPNPVYPASYYRPQLIRLTFTDGSVLERTATRVPVFGPHQAPAIRPEALKTKLTSCAAFAGVTHPDAGQRLYDYFSTIREADDVDAFFRNVPLQAIDGERAGAMAEPQRRS